jgi:hypothetical protein
MSMEQNIWHLKAVKICKQQRRLEWQLIEVLQKIDRQKIYLKLGVTSLFKYATRILDLSEATAYGYITVARKAAEVPALRDALANRSLSVAKASRASSIMTTENAAELIESARTMSKREIDFEVAKLSPRPRRPDLAKPITEDLIEIRTTVSKETYEILKRAEAIVAQKSGKNPNLAEVLSTLGRDYVERHDPLKKARRSLEKNVSKPKLCPDRVAKSVQPRDKRAPQPTLTVRSQRKPLTAAQKHQVFARDGGRSTHIGPNGKRCENDRWLHIHHIKPVSAGGNNESANLTTLCSTHHDLVHQLALPIEGQVTWLRSRVQPYRVVRIRPYRAAAAARSGEPLAEFS